MKIKMRGRTESVKNAWTLCRPFHILMAVLLVFICVPFEETKRLPRRKYLDTIIIIIIPNSLLHTDGLRNWNLLGQLETETSWMTSLKCEQINFNSWHVETKAGSCALTQHDAMKEYGVVEVQFDAFLTSALDGGEWSASHPGRFTPRERAPGTHWIGGWMGPRAGLDAVVNRKIPSPCRNWNPRLSRP
jgi:hypothetical protein